MEKKYSIDIIDEVTTIRFAEEPDILDIQNSIDDVAELKQKALRLWNFSNGGLNLTSTQIQELADYAKSKFSPPSRVAIVATEDLAFGLSRMYEAFRAQDMVDIEIFRNEQDAHNWLKNNPEK